MCIRDRTTLALLSCIVLLAWVFGVRCLLLPPILFSLLLLLSLWLLFFFLEQLFVRLLAVAAHALRRVLLPRSTTLVRVRSRQQSSWRLAPPPYSALIPVSYTHLTLPTKRIV
eukprot:TRINITY_DN12549_c0_g1_i1.p2 TRINITY_DN12549_c0_g1~~TRINITY_DN12549_c0_g1_i1.p2  ORF type:complete len:113 (-),score=4.77 TRINITY_DN12549_c0_g1_i1:80-418(-)